MTTSAAPGTYISREDFIKLVKLFYQNVNGGCYSCAEDAVDSLMTVFKADFDWFKLQQEIKARRW